MSSNFKLGIIQGPSLKAVILAATWLPHPNNIPVSSMPDGIKVDNCKKVEELVPAIQKLQKQNIVTDEKLKEFVNEFFYKSDGKSTERVCKMILELVKQFKEKKQH